MRYHYVWLAWSGAFLLLWAGIWMLTVNVKGPRAK